MEFLMDQYLITGGVRLKSTKEQNFAKPIEDEDIFAVCTSQKESETANQEVDDTVPQDSDDDENLSADLFQNDQQEDISANLSYEHVGENLRNDEAHATEGDSEVQQPTELSGVDLDDIFADDYSRSPEPMRPSNDYSRSNNNPEEPTNENSATKQTPQLTPAQIKAREMKEKLKAQVKSMAIKPNKLGTGFGKDGFIEVTVEQQNFKSSGQSKFIFNKLFNQSKKANDQNKSPENNKRSWQYLRESMRKKICAQRRKVWDSFNVPVDEYDEEEEIVGESTEADEEVENVLNDGEELEDEEVGDRENQPEHDNDREDMVSDDEPEEGSNGEEEDSFIDDEEDFEDGENQLILREAEEDDAENEKEADCNGDNNKISTSSRPSRIIIDDDDSD